MIGEVGLASGEVYVLVDKIIVPGVLKPFYIDFMR